MDRIEALKRITREVLGRSDQDFLRRVDRMLEEEGTTNASLLLAARKIESLVKFYISEPNAAVLGEKYREYLKKNTSYL